MLSFVQVFNKKMLLLVFLFLQISIAFSTNSMTCELADLTFETTINAEPIDSTEDAHYIRLSKRRYQKGIELIRLLYEKILGLDHHFSSLQSTHGLQKLTNPHHYPAFQTMMEKLDKTTRKKFNQMPEVWHSNPFLLSGFLHADLMSTLNTEQAEELGCLLDFTSRMYSDLNLIFYETQYLKLSNEELKENCQELFNEYTKGIGYHVPLDVCRENDDWENLNIRLNEYVQEMTALYDGTPEEAKRAYNMHSNLSFPLNLIVDFINKYTVFISDGTKHYKKFQIILKNYRNNEVCVQHLPDRFLQLQKEVIESIEKFDAAYYIAELKGSKLKDLLFGVGD